MMLAMALLTTQIGQAPALTRGREHLWSIADDGSCLAMGAGREIWRARDWRQLPKNPVFLYYEEGRRKLHTLDVSQRTHVKVGAGWHWEDDIANFCMHTESLWGALHNATVVGYFRTHYPKGSQVVSFVRRDKRGSDPNRESLVLAGKSASTVGNTMAFNGNSQIDLAQALITRQPDFEFAGWTVPINGVAKLRFRRKSTLAGVAKSGYWGVNVALSTDRIAIRLETRPGEFQILDGPSGKRWSVKLPPGTDVGRTVVAKNDLYVYSPAKSATLRYSFVSKKWSPIPGLAIVCVSGNGKFGAFARIADRRAVVKRL